MSDRNRLGDAPIDKTVSAFKAASSIVPAGGFFAELVTTFIPNQRIDRIETFIKRLDDRIELLEEKEAKRFHERKANPEYVSLFEDGAFHAARSPSEDRIKYNSSAVINGMTSEHISAVEARHLLGLLNEINDIEMVWLCHFSHKRELGVPNEYYEKHYDILKPISRSLGQADEMYEAAALQDSYKDHLERLKLIELSNKSHYATTLGRMVLELAGLA
ncbi:hypothetical protein [Maridesulfovibrio hydrothermalis]|uniref:Uncharacterized protein n=1 Tax=Maridesulfovibrio hydrothermalis AM13 = DSM 14728 TaxID=1121451 RepID=L0R8V5_9BACT|nr:hypothetical protein [Maridesulfovibrio hydrothermalis]CCO22001.1 conserved protein of unknown function [Maridesulfovibrio hydrothermalis AM13 = DSM 14728]